MIEGDEIICASAQDRGREGELNARATWILRNSAIFQIKADYAFHACSGNPQIFLEHVRLRAVMSKLLI